MALISGKTAAMLFQRDPAGPRCHARVMTLVLLLAAGCGANATQAASDAAIAMDAGTSNSAAVLGAFVVNLVPRVLGGGGTQTSAAYTSILGKVYDGPMPAAIVWTVVEEAGGCQLLTPRVPFCEQTCGGAAACVEGDRCAPYPIAQNLGRVHVKGLGGTEFDMDPIAGNYQPGAGVALPYPPCPEGAVVEVSGPRGPLGAFSIESRGITPLVFEQNPAPTAGQPLRLTWAPPGQRDLTRIEVKLDVSHHGGTKGKIECNTPDTGSLEISASQVSQLIGLGTAGFPTIVLTRVAAGTTAGPAGVIALRVLSAVERAVEIEGLLSCTANSQCPAGQVCQSNLTCM